MGLAHVAHVGRVTAGVDHVGLAHVAHVAHVAHPVSLGPPLVVISNKGGRGVGDLAMSPPLYFRAGGVGGG